jgi:methionine-S-sulfoxide reductase
MKTATTLLGAGCFWGVQAYFDQVPGVIKTTVGYSGGHVANPTYEMVCSHTTGHAEVTEIEFDPVKISYEDILCQFFRMHDPTQLNRQGPDVGDSYRTVIFYFDDAQREAAEKVKAEQQAKFDKPIVTEIAKAGPFYKAEEYHQKFFEKTGRGACHIPYAPLP